MGSLPEGKNKRSYKSKVFCSCNKNSLCKTKCECPSAGEIWGSSCGCFPVNVPITDKQAMPRTITKLGQRERVFVSLELGCLKVHSVTNQLVLLKVMLTQESLSFSFNFLYVYFHVGVLYVINHLDSS